MRLGRRLLTSVVLLIVAATPAAAYVTFVDCNSVSMTVTATYPNDPGFEGLYKYTLTGSYDVGQHAVSHIDILLMLGDCNLACLPGAFAFPSPAGHSTGSYNGSPCDLLYSGIFMCQGDPSIPPNLREPTAKFQPVTEQLCNSTTAGSGTWCFYSALPPGNSATHPDLIVIKHGNTACLGDVVGELPICAQQTTAVGEASWGAVKSLFR